MVIFLPRVDDQVGPPGGEGLEKTVFEATGALFLVGQPHSGPGRPCEGAGGRQQSWGGGSLPEWELLVEVQVLTGVARYRIQE